MGSEKFPCQAGDGYIWAVDDMGEVYEAKLDGTQGYHGYRLSADERTMRKNHDAGETSAITDTQIP